MSLRNIHDFEVALLDPCLAMTERGMQIDEAKRVAMLADLEAMRAPLEAEASATALAALASHAARVPPTKAHLFVARRVCACCRNGKAKRAACWACAGFAAKPSKKQLAESIADIRALDMILDGVADEYALQPCKVCGGAGASEARAFNANSPQQIAIVLYDVLKLPKRTKDGAVCTDEEALKSLLALAPPDAAALIRQLLTLGKIDTMRGILVRIAPAEDGRIRTVYNPAGTETGRFSSSETFLVRSTNLQNMPKREATEARFDVRACFVAKPGHVLIEADLSGAEAWVTAACCGDTRLLELLRSGAKLHRWTAAQALHKPEAEVTEQEYSLYKTARHALNYGMQWATFQRNVNMVADRTGVAISAAQAKQVYVDYHTLHPRLAGVWWPAVQQQLALRGTLTTCFGRMRTFYGRERGAWLGDTHREAIAYEPQSTIADLLNRGLLRWWRQHDGKIGDVVAQVHDSVVLEVPSARAPLATALLRACLTEEIEVHSVRITIPVEVTVRATWATFQEAA